MRVQCCDDGERVGVIANDTLFYLHDLVRIATLGNKFGCSPLLFVRLPTTEIQPMLPFFQKIWLRFFDLLLRFLELLLFVFRLLLRVLEIILGFSFLPSARSSP